MRYNLGLNWQGAQLISHHKEGKPMKSKLIACLVGASSGALIGWAAGCPWCGAAIGGGVGMLGGYVYDQYEKSQGRP